MLTARGSPCHRQRIGDLLPAHGRGGRRARGLKSLEVGSREQNAISFMVVLELWHCSGHVLKREKSC